MSSGVNWWMASGGRRAAARRAEVRVPVVSSTVAWPARASMTGRMDWVSPRLAACSQISRPGGRGRVARPVRSRGGELVKRGGDAFGHHLAIKFATGIRHGATVGDVRHEIHFVAAGVEHSGGIFATRFTATQLVEAQVGDDPVQPGVKRTLKPEVAEVPVRLDEGVLMYILRVLLVAQHVQRKAEDALVVAPDERIERTAITALRLPDELVVFDSLLGAGIDLRLRQLAAVADPGLCRSLHWRRFYAN